MLQEALGKKLLNLKYNVLLVDKAQGLLLLLDAADLFV